MKKIVIIFLFVWIVFLIPAFSQEKELLVLKNTSFIDVEKGELVNNVDIVIKESLIQEINTHSSGKNYPNAKVIDLEGCFIIPGLIEGHTHISPISEKSLTIALKKGVTALRDMAGDGEYLKLLQDAVKSGDFMGPDIYFSALMGGPDLILNDSRVKISTPPAFNLGEAPWMRLVDTNSDIPQIIKEARECGATGIKIYAYLTADLVNELVAEAKKQNMKVWSHWNVYPATPEDIVDADVDVVSHIFFLLTPPNWNYKDGSKGLNATHLNQERNRVLFSKMKANNIYLDPTIVVAREMFSSDPDKTKVDALNKAVYEIVKDAYKSQVKIIAGTDIFFPKDEGDKLPLHEEIEFLVEKVGINPAYAIKAATIFNAEVLGIDNTQGSIEVGKIANLVVLSDNPLIDIHHIENVKLVIKNGKIIN